MDIARYAILFDGGYVDKVLRNHLARQIEVRDVAQLAHRICSYDDLSTKELLRAYYYDAPPATTKVRWPISGRRENLALSPVHRRMTELHDGIERLPDFSVRRGEVRV